VNALDVLCAQLTHDLFAIAKFLFYYVMRMYSVDYAVARRLSLSVRPSVCPSVCSSHASIVSKRVNIGYYQTFSLSGSHTILVFSRRTIWPFLAGTP